MCLRRVVVKHPGKFDFVCAQTPSECVMPHGNKTRWWTALAWNGGCCQIMSFDLILLNYFLEVARLQTSCRRRRFLAACVWCFLWSFGPNFFSLSQLVSAVELWSSDARVCTLHDRRLISDINLTTELPDRWSFKMASRQLTVQFSWVRFALFNCRLKCGEVRMTIAVRLSDSCR
jgi:hypothetical protein